MTLYFEEEGAVTLPLDCEKTGTCGCRDRTGYTGLSL